VLRYSSLNGRIWRNAFREAGVPHIRFYELRHAGLSRHVDRIGQDGALTLKEIQERAGRGSATMTLDRYARSGKPDRAARRRALDAAVAIETTNVTPIASRRRAY
jgi:integrase